MIRFFLIFLVVCSPCFGSEYYVFDSSGQATAALNYINAHSMFPITAKNFRTNQNEPGRQKTLRWANGLIQRLDGKWVFPRIPLWIRATLSQNEIDAFDQAFDYTIESYDNSWVNQE